jgi:hypothetical protein
VVRGGIGRKFKFQKQTLASLPGLKSREKKQFPVFFLYSGLIFRKKRENRLKTYFFNLEAHSSEQKSHKGALVALNTAQFYTAIYKKNTIVKEWCIVHNKIQVPLWRRWPVTCVRNYRE